MSPAFCPEIYDEGWEMAMVIYQNLGLDTYPTNHDFSQVIMKDSSLMDWPFHKILHCETLWPWLGADDNTAESPQNLHQISRVKSPVSC